MVRVRVGVGVGVEVEVEGRVEGSVGPRLHLLGEGCVKADGRRVHCQSAPESLLARRAPPALQRLVKVRVRVSDQWEG